MIIRPGTELYDRYFKQLGDEKFESLFPPHRVLVESFADPSLDIRTIDENFAISGQIGSAGLLRSQAVKDVQHGVRHMLRSMIVEKLGDQVTSNGVLSHLLGAVEKLTFPEELAAILEPEDVKFAMGLSTKSGTGGKIVRAAFGVGLSLVGSLSATGPVGAIVGAIAGLIVGIFSIFANKKVKEQQAREERLRQAYMRMPPLQQPAGEVDDWYVNVAVLPTMQTGSWTRLFSPRFDPRKEWVGQPRNGGAAFAPGTPQTGENDHGETDYPVFVAAGGVGFIPGMNRVTSVIQVSLDPFDPSIASWRKGVGGWPVRQVHATDVGDFYWNTARLAAIAWSWVSAQDASLELYKVFVGAVEHPQHDSLHYLWREYCEGGLRFLTENADDFYYVDPKTKKLSTARMRNEDPRFLFGAAIGCAIGTWRCYLAKGSTNHKAIYRSVDAGGVTRFDMGDPANRVRGLSEELGCVMYPPAVRAQDDGRLCLTTIYESNIRDTLVRVRERQQYFLRHSLICAYVRQSWDAFLDPEIRGLLLRMRKTLLEHPDRKLVRLADVPENEPGVAGGSSWKAELTAAGVPKVPFISRLASSPGTLEPTAEPAPTVPGGDARMPFGGLVARPVEPAMHPFWKYAAWTAGAGAVGLGAYALYRRHQGANR